MTIEHIVLALYCLVFHHILVLCLSESFMQCDTDLGLVLAVGGWGQSLLV